MTIREDKCKKCEEIGVRWQLLTGFGVEARIITFCENQRCSEYHRIRVVEGRPLTVGEKVG